MKISIKIIVGIVLLSIFSLAFLSHHSNPPLGFSATDDPRYWANLIRRVPESCGGEPHALTRLPMFQEYMFSSKRPRILVIDVLSCSHPVLVTADDDAQTDLRTLQQSALDKCAEKGGKQCHIVLQESCFQHPGAMPQIAYPGLTTRPRWKTKDVMEAVRLEASFDEILTEFSKLVDQGHLALHPEGLAAKDDDWKVFTMWSAGQEHEEATALAPVSAGIWREIQNTSFRARNMAFGLYYFSVLVPGARLVSHFGMCNMRLRIHLGLVVPETGVSMKLNKQQLRWKTGKAVVFDDSFLHSVRNDNTSARAVLIADIWHPDLPEAERKAIAEMVDLPKRSHPTKTTKKVK